MFCTYTHAMSYEEFNGTIYNSVRLCSCDQPFPGSQNGNSTNDLLKTFNNS